MKEVTYGSEQARLQWRDMLDAAFRGMKVIVERYGKPTVVIVSYEKYQELERRAAQAEPSSLMAMPAKDDTRISEKEVKASMGPLDELYQLVESEEEWYDIIERARVRAGIDSPNDDKALMYAEIEKEMESLRQRQRQKALG